MISAVSGAEPFGVQFSNGVELGHSDALPEKGGLGAGFRPHELLEAALASCMNMSVRMYAERHFLPLEKVLVRVSLNRSQPNRVVFEYNLDMEGPLTDEHKVELMGVAEACPVRATLSKDAAFELVAGDAVQQGA